MAADGPPAPTEAGAPDPSLLDPLTGLVGPELVADRLARSVAAARNNDRAVMYALIDLDRFGRANDQLDDHIGDQILKIVAARLRDALRSSDTVGHLGDDEFAVIVERPGDAEFICRRLVETIGEPMDIGGISVWLTASIGAAMGNSENPDDFRRFATIALQRSKERGGDSCTVLGRA